VTWPWDHAGSPLQGARLEGAGSPLADPLANPPGRSQLSYRVGTYDTFVSQMLDRLVMNLAADSEGGSAGRRSVGSAGGAEDGRYVRFNLAGEGNWLVALTHSWAEVADVLSFYQERLIQEGYIDTAVEPRSVYELAHMVGYQPTPGVAGHTDLAIEVTDVKGLPREIELPAHLVVRSVPPPGAQPQTFETVAPLFARASWNILVPQPRGRREVPKVEAGATSVLLAGATTGLAAGVPLLVVGEIPPGVGADAHVTATAGEPGDSRELRCVRRLTEVAPAGEVVATRVAWKEPLSLDLVRRRSDQPAPDEAERLAALAETEVAEPTVLTLPRQAGLFGRAAPPWASLPAQVKRQEQGLAGGVVVFDGDGWQSRNIGLPVEVTVVSLAAGRGHVYAGTMTQGVFHSADGGQTWAPSRRGLAQLDAPALTVDHRGVVWTGGTGGGVYRSTDHGEIWEDASGRHMGAVREPWWSRFRPFRKAPSAGALPGAAIHDLEALPIGTAGDEATAVLAATGAGVYRSDDGGRSWRPANRGLPGTKAPAGTSDLAVRRLARGGARGTVWAASLRGVYFSADAGEHWQPRNRGLPGADPFTGFSATRVDDVAVVGGRREGQRLLAATDTGLYLSDDGGEHWQPRALAVAGAGAGGEVLAAAGPVVDPRAPVTGLQVVEDPVNLDRRVYAATATDFWESRDDGDSWGRVTPFPPGPVLALASGDDPAATGVGALAAVPFAGFADDWPGFYLHGGEIDLDGVVPGVVPGSWVVLVPGGTDDPTAAGVYRVQRVTRLRRRDFGLDTMITRLQVEPDPRLAGFDLRDTQVFLDSRALALNPVRVVDHDLALNVLGVELRSMPPTRRIIVTGELPARKVSITLLADTKMIDLKKVGGQLETLPPDLDVTLRIWSSPAGPVDTTSEPGSILELTVQDLLDFLGTLIDSHGRMARAVGREAGRPAWVEAADAPEAGGEVAAEAAASAPAEEALPDTMPGVLADTLKRMMARAQEARRSRRAVAPEGAEGAKLSGEDGADQPCFYLEIEAPARRVGTSTMVSELSARLHRCRQDPSMPSQRAVTLPGFPGEEARVVDAASLRIHGNVVSAVEGATVAGEVLGDGDATVPNQVFRLAQPPAFRLGGTPEDAGTDAADLVSSLEVRVQGQLWHPVEHLEGRGPNDRVYRLDVDQDGVGRVVFGSGQQGARLPTGKDNVRATYSTGMTTGSVPEGGVSLPQNRPLGLNSVSNPLPTTPGAEAEDPDQARQLAPRSVLTLGRVVSLGDYADFALGFPGIAKAGSWRLPPNDPSAGSVSPGRAGRAAVQVTVAVPGGGPAPAGVLEDLWAAIAARRPEDLPLYVHSYRPVRVRAEARLLIDPDFPRKVVEDAVTRLLLARFGFARARFGGAISAAEVVRAMQRVPGVESVDLDELSAYDGRSHRNVGGGTGGGAGSGAGGGSGAGARGCRARPPAWEDGELRPAELLIMADVVLKAPEAAGLQRPVAAVSGGRRP